MAKLPNFLKNWRTVRQFKRLKYQLFECARVPETLEAEAITAKNRLLDELTVRELFQTPIEELKKYRSGARMQSLQGYSVMNALNIPESYLSNMRGIGPKSARLIKQAANSYAQEVRQKQKIRFRPDTQTEAESDCLKKLYQLDELEKIAEEAERIKKDLGERGELAKRARAATNPALWAVSRKKENAIESLDEIQELLQTTLVTTIESLSKKRSEVLKAQHDEYWRAFYNDPVRYYSRAEGLGQKGKRGTETSSDVSYINPVLLEAIESVEFDTRGLKCILRPYQRLGVKYILNQQCVLLGDEMGLGKTVEAIATMVSLRNNGDTHFVVICPASVLINWSREIENQSDLASYVVHGKERLQSLSEWSEKGGVAIINYENASCFSHEGDIALTVVDEAHYIKNRYASRTQETIRILNQSQRKLLMTGTPLENKLDEMVSLIGLLQPYIVKQIYRLPRPIRQDDFRHVIAPVYFRRTKDTVWTEMPELQVVPEIISLTPRERSLYIECLRNRDMSSFTRIRQISFEVEREEDSSKLARIKEICEEAFSNGRKVLIFSFYLNTITKIQNAFSRIPNYPFYGPITGSDAPSKRQAVIDRFSERSGGAVLLAQILAGGTGLNIQKASIVIMCEPQYKPSIENQAIARSYRMGQTNDVTVYRLLSEKTVDERILQVLKEKQAIFDAYADKSESGEQSFGISEADIARAEFERSLVS